MVASSRKTQKKNCQKVSNKCHESLHPAAAVAILRVDMIVINEWTPHAFEVASDVPGTRLPRSTELESFEGSGAATGLILKASTDLSSSNSAGLRIKGITWKLTWSFGYNLKCELISCVPTNCVNLATEVTPASSAWRRAA